MTSRRFSLFIIPLLLVVLLVRTVGWSFVTIMHAHNNNSKQTQTIEASSQTPGISTESEFILKPTKRGRHEGQSAINILSRSPRGFRNSFRLL